MCTKHYRIVSYALFANEGEPEQSADFLARVRENKVDFLDFMVPGAWGTIWGTTWFEVRGRIDRESVKGRAVELVGKQRIHVLLRIWTGISRLLKR